MADAEPTRTQDGAVAPKQETDRAQALFERGDFHALRDERADSTNPQAVEGRIAAAVHVDPVHAAVLIVCALLLLAIAAYYFGGAQ